MKSGVWLPLLLAGCAAQQPELKTEMQAEMKARVDPLAARMAQVEDGVRANAAALRALENQSQAARTQMAAQTEARLTALEGRVQGSESMLDAMRHKAAHIAGQVEQQETAQKAAQQAMQAQTDARVAALAQTQAQEDARLGERLARIEKQLADTGKRLAALDRMLEQARIRDSGKLLFSLTLTADKALYPLNNPELEAADIAQLNSLAERLKAIAGEYHLDIQGHTDAWRGEDFDYALGRARAEVVRRYLHNALSVEPWRMTATSYGSSQPLVGGTQGNRRILIRVLVPDEK